VIHDWNYILTTLHLLRYTYVIANTLYTLGCCTILLGIILAFYYLYEERPHGRVGIGA
jgi:hypothetical protein